MGPALCHWRVVASRGAADRDLDVWTAERSRADVDARRLRPTRCAAFLALGLPPQRHHVERGRSPVKESMTPRPGR
ncbi:MAG: hypothetical protein ACLQUY_22975 [Ktedonobacterales bacterium]